MRKILYLFILLYFIAMPVQAAIESALGDQDASGNQRILIDSTGIYPSTDSTYDVGSSSAYFADGYFDAIHTSDTKKIQFTANDFILNTPAELTTTSQPGLEQDNGMTSIVWADGEETPAQLTFQVPDDYTSYGVFNVVCGQGSLAATAANQLAWGVYINGEGDAWDTTVWNGTPITVEGDATADIVTISATPFTSGLSAGDILTINLWRYDGGSTGTADLEEYYAFFSYKE